MANVKTAISLKRALFDQVNSLAGEMKISRSQLFSLAAQEFIQKYENQKLLLKINQAYDDFPDTIEKRLQDGIRQHQRSMVKEQW